MTYNRRLQRIRRAKPDDRWKQIDSCIFVRILRSSDGNVWFKKEGGKRLSPVTGWQAFARKYEPA